MSASSSPRTAPGLSRGMVGFEPASRRDVVGMVTFERIATPRKMTQCLAGPRSSGRPKESSAARPTAVALQAAVGRAGTAAPLQLALEGLAGSVESDGGVVGGDVEAGR